LRNETAHHGARRGCGTIMRGKQEALKILCPYGRFVKILV